MQGGLSLRTAPAGAGEPGPRASDTTGGQGDLPLVALTSAVFLGYMTIGLGLPVIPLYVHQTLGFGNFLVGLSIGIQFLATVLTRGFAGRVADHQGASRSMRSGLMFCALSGVGYILAVAAPLGPAGRLIVLMAARLVLGFGESQLVVGALAWGIGLSGPARTGRVLSWTGMAIYGSLAAGAPIGLWLNRLGGFGLIGAVIVGLPLAGLALSAGVRRVTPHGGSRQALSSIFNVIWLPGLGVALQGVGFAAIGSFVSLDFVAHQWSGAAFALTCFGGAFVAVRALFGRLPDRIGGARVAAVSLVIETAGQLVLWHAGSPTAALFGAALTGCGCSMVFPSFGVEVVKKVPPQSRGTALGGFAAFQDVAYGVTGPLAGVIASSFGYASVFAMGAIAAVAGLVIALLTWWASQGRASQGGASQGRAVSGGG
jgi:MFS family permease